MRYRARNRHAHSPRIVFWDANYRALWPQPDMSSWSFVMSPIDRLIDEYGSMRDVPFQKLAEAAGIADDPALVWRPPRFHDLDDVAAELGIDLDDVA